MPADRPSPPRSYALDQRAAQAREEIGHTDIGRGPKLVLIFAFLLTLVTVPALQTVHEIGAPDRVRGNLAIFSEATEALAILIAARPPASLPHPDYAPERLQAAGPLDRLFLANRFMLRSIQSFEDDLRDDSLLSTWLQPASQSLRSGLFGVGNEKTLIGRDGWLFFHEAVSHSTRGGFLDPARQRARSQTGSEWQPPPQPDPVAALLHLRLKLAQRNIALIVVLVPNKPVLYADMLSGSHGPCSDGALRNPSYARLLAELADPALFFRARFPAVRALLRNPAYDAQRPLLDELEAGRSRLEGSPTWVYDPTAELLGARCRDGQQIFLKADLHWRPEAVRRTAAGLADFIRTRLALPPVWDRPPATQPLEVEALGDIGRMLRLPAKAAAAYREAVEIQQVLDGDGLHKADPGADVLLLGDSFSNIYSLEAMGWGEGAGLAEHLALTLLRPVDSIARNDRGAHQSRQELDRALARGHDRLAGKRVVIFEFNVRELTHGDWKLLPMALAKTPPAALFAPEAGQALIASGTVQAISHVPRPFAVPYKDHLCAVHLVDLAAAGQKLPPGASSVVYMHSMQDNRWTPVPRLRLGDRIRVRLTAWDESGPLGSLNRSDLDELELEQHSFATLISVPGLGAGGAPDAAERPRIGWPEALASLLLAFLLAALLLLIDRREQRQADPREGEVRA